jgi:gliding motility-associated-like protein
LKKKLFKLISIALAASSVAYGQSLPIISYDSPVVLTAKKSTALLLPTLTGGAIFPAHYSKPQTLADYATPFSLAVDKDDNVYSTNNTTGDVTKFNPSGNILLTFNTGNDQVSEVAIDATGNIFVSQFTENTVLKYNKNGKLIATITGFDDPYGIAFDSNNNAFVANYKNGTISKIASGDSVATTYISGLNNPYGIIVDSNNTIFVSEQSVGNIIKIDPITLSQSLFCSGFNGPRHLSLDKFGNIYVADFGNNLIKKIDKKGQVTSITSEVNSPRQCAFDSSGNLYIADFGTNTVKKCIASSFSIDENLPPGLIFDKNTGKISGTPTVWAEKKTYQITAYNTTGAGSFSLVLSVDTLKDVKPLQPTIFADAATGVTSTAATINGHMVRNYPNLTASFTYSANPDFSGAITLPANFVSDKDGSSGSITNTLLSALKPATRYYYYLKAVGTFGTIFSDTVEFVTSPMQKGNTASLSVLNINGYELTPGFSASILNYSLTVSDTTTVIKLLALPTDLHAIVKINGITTSGNSSPTSIYSGSVLNRVTINVTAEDGVTNQIYTLNLVRKSTNTGTGVPPADTLPIPVVKSKDASLAMLKTDPYSLNPRFSASMLSYSLTMSDTTTVMKVLALPTHPQAIVKINGMTVTGASSPTSIYLGSVLNKVTINVTAEDGVTNQIYTLNLVRKSTNTGTGNPPADTLPIPVVKNKDAHLAMLKTGSYSLNPVFSVGELNYSLTVSDTTTILKLLALPADSKATVKINGITSSATTSPTSIFLGTVLNKVTINVTAEDGVTNQIYNVNLVRKSTNTGTGNPPADTLPVPVVKNRDASLAVLKTDPCDLNPEFSTSVLNYSLTVSDTTTILKILALAANSKATVKINGVPTSGNAFPTAVILGTALNKVTINVTAEDGITNQVYTLYLIRKITTPLPPVKNDPYSPIVSNSTLSDKIVVHQAVTPNGDGKNDFFQIEGLEKFSENKVTIINTNGVKVYEARGYNNGSNAFDGRSNFTGALQQQGTYYYRLEYNVNHETIRKLGYVVLKY